MSPPPSPVTEWDTQSTKFLTTRRTHTHAHSTHRSARSLARGVHMQPVNYGRYAPSPVTEREREREWDTQLEKEVVPL